MHVIYRCFFYDLYDVLGVDSSARHDAKATSSLLDLDEAAGKNVSLSIDGTNTFSMKDTYHPSNNMFSVKCGGASAGGENNVDVQCGSNFHTSYGVRTKVDGPVQGHCKRALE